MWDGLTQPLQPALNRFERDHILNMTDARRGLKFSDAHRAALAQSKLGKPRPPEHRAAIRAGIAEMQQVTKTPEHRAAISAAKQGKPWTDAQRAGFERAMEERRRRRAAAPPSECALPPPVGAHWSGQTPPP